MGNRRRRYALHDEEIDARIEALVADVARTEGREDDRELARQLLVTGLRLLREERTRR